GGEGEPIGEQVELVLDADGTDEALGGAARLRREEEIGGPALLAAQIGEQEPALMAAPGHAHARVEPLGERLRLADGGAERSLLVARRVGEAEPLVEQRRGDAPA